MSIFFVIPSAYHCLVIHKLANGDNFNKKEYESNPSHYLVIEDTIVSSIEATREIINPTWTRWASGGGGLQSPTSVGHCDEADANRSVNDSTHQTIMIE